MTLPLSDIHVLDYAQVFAGPLIAMLLADQGAEVIKLEPAEGDSTRRSGPNLVSRLGLSQEFVTYNRNKRSVLVDSAKPRGREVFERLVRWADVVVVNMRLGARQRRRASYEDLASINPRLIYASVTAYGERGPEADLPGIDMVVQARVGDIAGRRLPGGPMPSNTRLVHFDMATAMLGAYAVMLALHQRERTGRGDRVEVNILQSALVCQTGQMTRVQGSQEWRPFLISGTPSIFQCADGRYIFASSGGQRWEDFCHATGLDHLITDPRFDTPTKREQQGEAIKEVLSRHFSTRPAAEWETLLKAKGHIASVLKDVNEVYEDPQVVANEMIAEFEQPGLGTVRAVNSPVKLYDSAGERHIRRPAPTKGQHTTEVLLELGYSRGEIEALIGAGAVSQGEEQR